MRFLDAVQALKDVKLGCKAQHTDLSSAWLLGLQLFGFPTLYIKEAKDSTFRGGGPKDS